MCLVARHTQKSCDWCSSNKDLKTAFSFSKMAQSRSGGYDYQFVEEPSDDLKCLICLCVARDPQQHGNGAVGKFTVEAALTSIRREMTSAQTVEKL